MKDFSYVTNSHPKYMEDLYKRYKQDPNAVDAEYKKFFDGFDFALAQEEPAAEGGSPMTSARLDKEFAVYQLIQDYKKKGHLLSDTNPIRSRKDRHPQLDLSFFNLTESDLKTSFYAGKLVGLPNASLQEILDKLKKVYCGKFGVEYVYIKDNKKIEWIEKSIERVFSIPISIEEKKRIATKLTESSIFETFLHKKFIGQKRFSLEGSETTITLLDQLINTGADLGAQEFVLGMAHRGRLNALATILRKPYEQIFNEFEGVMPTDSTMGSGDVKYHMGFSSEIKTSNNKNIYIKLAPNPSHLETVSAVVMGYTRSKSTILYEQDHSKIIPIVIHGDASIAGQGIVYELLQMSALKGYQVGGTIHVVINNQIGFTTDFSDARSSDYCTSIAATIQAPVFHVNGDDPETIARIGKIAADYRQTFKEDIFIDIVCYRKHGHNEGDDPKYTQPALYKIIESHKSAREIYLDHLRSSDSKAEVDLAEKMEKTFWDDLQNRLDAVKQKPLPYTLQQYEKRWAGFRKAKAEDFKKSPDTSINAKEMTSLVTQLLSLPKDFTPLPKINAQLKEKLELFEKEKKIDWATAELLAYANLMQQGIRVRLSGEDVARGTFSHRHAILFSEDGQSFNRLDHIKGVKQKSLIFNSLLSEYAVLGFEYGYSISMPNCLVIWEAQFGDFVNGAQIIIDQYISCAEEKWGIASGITLFLPHGYEGQGPEHSSARIERILQLCAENNMFVTNITTAANLFHALNRQVKLEFRKPLINFSPKANLRHPGSYSSIEEFTKNSFKEIIADSSISPQKSKRVIVCSGKLYFELEKYRADNGIKDVAIIRIEQLHPFPIDQWKNIKKEFGAATKWVWAQEEPRNMGAYSYLRNIWENEKMLYISRPASAATATGFYKKQQQEQQQIIEDAFKL